MVSNETNSARKGAVGMEPFCDAGRTNRKEKERQIERDREKEGEREREK